MSKIYTLPGVKKKKQYYTPVPRDPEESKESKEAGSTNSVTEPKDKPEEPKYVNILFQLEDRVKQQYATDYLDEQMYVVLRDLTEKIIMVRGLISVRSDAAQVAHDYALALWVRVCGGVVIGHWTKYIILNLSTPLHNYYKSNGKRPIDLLIEDPVDESSFIESMYGAANTNEYIRTFEVEDYLDTLYLSVRDTVLKYSRTTNIVMNRRLYLAVLANLLQEKSLAGLSPDHADYVEFLTKLVRLTVYNNSLDTISNPTYQSLAKILRVDALELEGNTFA